MAKYFFHLSNDEEILLDAEGRELGPDKVPSAALHEAREIISADARSGCIDLNQRIEVRDSGGDVVHGIDFEDAVEIIRGTKHAA